MLSLDPAWNASQKACAAGWHINTAAPLDGPRQRENLEMALAALDAAREYVLGELKLNKGGSDNGK